jgi:hypothetical protein
VEVVGTMEIREMNAGIVSDAPLEVIKWSYHGQESFHPDVGEFWLPSHALVDGDWNEFEDLKALSDWMDEHDLKVFETPRYGSKAVVVPR